MLRAIKLNHISLPLHTFTKTELVDYRTVPRAPSPLGRSDRVILLEDGCRFYVEPEDFNRKASRRLSEDRSSSQRLHLKADSVEAAAEWIQRLRAAIASAPQQKPAKKEPEIPFGESLDEVVYGLPEGSLLKKRLVAALLQERSQMRKELQQVQHMSGEEVFYDILDASLQHMALSGSSEDELERGKSEIVEKIDSIKSIKAAESFKIKALDWWRHMLPATSETMPPVSLWSILKGAIGKDLFRIPVPIQFCEPLSMLQRVCEGMEGAVLLERAAREHDPRLRLALLGAFVVSEYAGTEGRVSKPFNPLLGETFEYIYNLKSSQDDQDCSPFYYLAEQVSHHPPVSAFLCTAQQWSLWGEVRVKSKFWGRCMELIPEGDVHFEIRSLQPNEPNLRFKWRRVTTTVNGIIMGRPWLDHYGTMLISPEAENSPCDLSLELEFFPTVSSPFASKSNNQRVEMRLVASSKHPNEQGRVIASGHWNRQIQARDSGELLWERGEQSVPSAHLQYHMTPFGMSLNQSEQPVPGWLCPTDSRWRPDARAMEEGSWSQSNTLKIHLERYQRDRLARHKHEPMWFKCKLDPESGSVEWSYQGGYWERRSKAQAYNCNDMWSDCPRIFPSSNPIEISAAGSVHAVASSSSDLSPASYE